MKKENKATSVTFRLSSTEKNIALSKAQEAGYTTISAFVRDHLITENPKQKTVHSPDSILIINELAKMATSIPASEAGGKIRTQIGKIYRIILGAKS